LWGRLIGIIYVLPLLYFWIRQKIPNGYHLKVIFGLCLGASQGLLGWYMVKSGLIDRPAVSHFRLAAHLGLAALIYSYLLWLGFQLRMIFVSTSTSKFFLKGHGCLSLGMVFLTLIWGAFVAGLDAGLVYNTWPLMGGRWIPLELTKFIDIIAEPVSVQFVHRWIGMITALMVLSFAYRVKSFFLAGIVFVQVGLGISTLLTQVWIPLAAFHQAGAFILIAVLVYYLSKVSKVSKK
jgi:cytochrome c oxidase assembly protein subunit 15